MGDATGHILHRTVIPNQSMGEEQRRHNLMNDLKQRQAFSLANRANGTQDGAQFMANTLSDMNKENVVPTAPPALPRVQVFSVGVHVTFKDKNGERQQGIVNKVAGTSYRVLPM